MNNAKILIADDSITMLKLVEMILLKEGYEVITASDGLEAINKIFNYKPDLIISDVTMPVMNGYQVCRLIKEEPETKHIPFIMLTAKDQKSDKFWGLKTGADEFLTKPFEPQMLVRTVQAMLQKFPPKKHIFDSIKEEKLFTAEEIIMRVNELLDKRLYESTVLNEISIISESIHNYQEIIEKVFSIINKVMDFDVAFFMLVFEDKTEIYRLIVTKYGMKIFDSLKEEALEEYNKAKEKKYEKTKKIFIEDLLKINEFTSENINASLNSRLHIKLKVRNKLLGIFSIGSIEENVFEKSKELVEMISRQIAIVIDSAILYNQVKNLAELKSRSLNIVTQVGELMGSMTDMNNLMKLIVSMAINVTSASVGSLLLYQKETNSLVFKVATGEKAQSLHGKHLKIGQGLAGYCALKCKTVNVANTGQDKRFDSSFDKEIGFSTQSVLCVPLLHKGKLVGVLEVINKKDKAQFTKEDEEILITLGNQIATALENARLYNEVQEIFISTVQSLSSAIDAKDKYTHGHSKRVCIYSLAIADVLKLPEEVKANLRLSALLHDIGKIGIPEAILTKPTRLTEEEFEQIKQHPEIGAKIIEPVKLLHKIISGIRFHHERYDGRGYPYGLKGKMIPLAGRIMAVADTYDAMTSDRSYRKGLSPKIALDEIQTCSGTQFDPEIVKAFLIAIKKFIV